MKRVLMMEGGKSGWIWTGQAKRRDLPIVQSYVSEHIMQLLVQTDARRSKFIT